MKNFFLALFITFAFGIKAQDTAKLIIRVQDENKHPINGEQIVFEAQNKNYRTIGISGKDGKAIIQLIGGDVYNIKIKTIGDEQEYNTIKIPSLGLNEKYGVNELTITIFEAKSFTLDNVYFDSGKSSLKDESLNELNELFEYLKLKKDINIEIAGHTDNVGDDVANMRLSENRANAVKNYLVEKGISANRIKIQAYGETQPIMTNDSAIGRAKNRRIEVNVL